MKLFSVSPKSPPAAEPSTVVQAPGDYFFVRRFDLPAGMAEGEVAGFIGLQLEELSPFPLEQLYHGHAVARDRSAVLVYAAYRRRFAPEHGQTWSRAMFVMPDFAPALRLEFERPTVVLLRSATAMTACRFDASKSLPVGIVARPLALEASDDEARRVRALLLATLGGEGLPAREMRITSAPQQRAQGLTFVLGPDGGNGAAQEIAIPTAECWAMDVRDPAFVAQQRRRLGFDVVLWRIIQGAAAALVLLLLGEIFLLAGRGYASWLGARVTAQAPVAAALEDRDLVANRLTDFGQSGLSPFAMLATAAGPKPVSVYFTRATAEGRNSLVIEAITQNVADMNAYEAALRGLAEVESAEVRNPRAREDGTTFSLVVSFKAGAFARSASQAPGVASTGGGGT